MNYQIGAIRHALPIFFKIKIKITCITAFKITCPLVTFYQDRGREAPWLPQFKIEIEKPLNRPKFCGKEAPRLPSIKSEVEKSLSCHN